jgi:ubiquinone/menaquinone biosynthesis C-methylase UbiE
MFYSTGESIIEVKMEEVGNQPVAPLAALLDVYSQRPDLQESFPEAGSGQYDRLIRWAAGVARKQFNDSSYEQLSEHEEWYFTQSRFVPKQNIDPASAFKTWDRAESLGSIERRIHDGVPVSMLHERADNYLNTLSTAFPWTLPRKGAVILEIGSGVGYIMQAASAKLRPSRIIGLDVAPAMIEKAKERLARDRVGIPAEFLAYDGITIPLDDQSIDFIYSVACLQHIPKPYVYNLFGEMLRILKPGGAAALHFLSFSVLKIRKDSFDFKLETAQQLAGAEGHWHHFYSREELIQVLTNGYDAQRVEVKEIQGALWAAFTP